MKRIVITGPTGAIGIAIIQRMIKENIEVLAICNPTSNRIDRIPKSPLVTIKKCDLNDIKKFSVDNKEPYDVFYHLGWNGTIGIARNDLFMQNANVKNAIDAVDLANRLGCHTFIGAGSQAEYGPTEEILKPDTKTFPDTGYGMGKLCAGMMTRLRCEQLGMKHIWIRVLSVYGPYDGWGSMIMSTICDFMSGISPKTTKGEQLWDYLYSKDAAEAFYLAGQRGKNSAVYCLGSGEAKPLKDYICTIQKVVNPNIDVEFGAIEYSPKQVMYLCADISALNQDLDFKPETDFEDGIRETWLWCKNNKVEK